MNFTGMTLYRGPSVLDDEPIIAVATLHSSNKKTGDMVQVWILREDESPTDAVKSGGDESVCGSCVHRHHTGGACYVVPFQGPQSVWHSYHKGKYPEATGKMKRRLRGRAVRFGAYGDPAAVPHHVWKGVWEIAGLVTGYTHQANHPRFDSRILEYCMVSADAESSSLAWRASGHRTFRVKTPDDPLLEGEVTCPASYRSDVQCIDCGLCNGSTQGGPSIAIDVHGQRHKRFSLIAKAA